MSKNSENSYVDKEAFSLLKNSRLNKFIYVKTLKLDEFLNDKPKIIKIDTEGSEIDVINGSQKIIKKYRPIFFIEVTNLSFRKIVQKFKKNNYLIFIYEYTFFKKDLHNNWIKSNLIQNNVFDIKIYKPEEMLFKQKKFMFNIICFPKENKKTFEDLYLT